MSLNASPPVNTLRTLQIQGAGFRKWGFGGFLKKALIPEGVPAYLLILVIPLEFLATFITRPITLALVACAASS